MQVKGDISELTEYWIIYLEPLDSEEHLTLLSLHSVI